MILYSITVNIDNDVHEEWLRWMRSVLLPEMMGTGCFIEKRMCRLYGDEASGGVTYSIQFVCSSMEDYKAYQEKHESLMQQKQAEKYSDKFVTFMTLLEIIE